MIKHYCDVCEKELDKTGTSFILRSIAQNYREIEVCSHCIPIDLHGAWREKGH